MTETMTQTQLDLRWTLSNAMSALRGVLAIPVAFTIAADLRWPTIAIAVAAMITDVLDGWLARRYNEVSDLGKILDPLADKIFMAVAVVMLLIEGWLPVWFVALVLVRDVLIFLGGLYVEQRTGLVLPSNYWGKAAVVALGISLLLLVGGAAETITAFFMAVAILLLGVSFVIYVIRALHAVRAAR